MSITTSYVDGQVLKAENVTEIVTRINANETNINGLSTNKVDKVSGKSLVLDTEIVKIHSHANSTILNNTTASYTTTEQTKLIGISTGANVNNISDVNATELTDTTDTSLHYHSSDRNRSNHTGTQSASTITQDSNNRFVSDTEKSTWNGKATQSNIDTSINAIQIGGRNYFVKSKNIGYGSYGVGITVDINNSDCPYGFYVIGDELAINWVRISGVIKSNGYWTVSWDMKGNQSKSLGIDVAICDEGQTHFITTSDNTWKRFSLTVNVTRYDGTMYIFVDFKNFTTSNFFIRNINIEKGNKATDFTPAIEDTQMLITNGTTATRPTATYIGQSHFDTTLGKPIWWNGTVWKDAIGTTV